MLELKKLRMDYLETPVGVEDVPQIGWIAQSSRKNARQAAYQVQVSREQSFSDTIIDTDWVESDESAHVTLPGAVLESAARYFVRARIQDDAGEESGWKTGSFVTGVLYGAWRGRFITAENNFDAACSKGTYLRKEWTARGPVKEAYVSTTALGLYLMTINGASVGAERLAPGWTGYEKHLCYQTYDVTALVREGANVIGAHLGAGWYKGRMSFTNERNIYGRQTALLAQLTVRYQDGSADTVVTDESWLGCNSPVHFAEIYDGELYDARLEQPGWDCPGFVPSIDPDFDPLAGPEPEIRVREVNPYTPDDLKAQIRAAAAYRTEDIRWHAVRALEQDLSILMPQPGCRVTIEQTLPVKDIITTPAGDTVLDFGQNLTGWVRFRVQGQAGEMAHLRCFEVLDAAGNAYFDNLRGAKAEVRFICDGQPHLYDEHFSFQGFRYVKIEAWPDKISADNFTACVVHSEMEQTGRFACAHPLVNQLQHNIEWGLRGNFLDIPTDCPQRDERLGWTGDAQIFCRTATFLRNTYPFFKKWLRDVALDQTPEGGVPHVVPNSLQYAKVNDWVVMNGIHSAGAWADVAVIAPWNLYQAYGDKRILADQFDSMRGWIDFMRSHAVDEKWTYRLQFGDWVALDGEEGSNYGATPVELTNMAYFAYSTGLFVKACEALGREEIVAEYRALYARIAARFRAEYLDERGVMTVQTQTAHIVALYFGLVPPEGVAGTLAGLLRLLEQRGGHLVTGFIGTPYFCHALSQNGAVDAAYALLFKEDFPSWLYQVKAGATTVWEHWDGMRPDGSMWDAGMNSFNHYAYGAIGEWLYRAVAGLEIDEVHPGYKHALIIPKTTPVMAWAEGSYESVYGIVSCRWDREDRVVTLTVKVPFNTCASVILEDGAAAPEGLAFARNEKGQWQAEAGAGEWEITYRLA